MPAAGLFDADVAFPALHGPFGEDGSVQGVLEWLDIPYVGSDVLASAVCMDKLTLKRLFAQAGLPQVEFVAAGERGLARALRGDGPAALGQALAARLERRHQPGRELGRGARRGRRPGPAPRPTRDRRGARCGSRGRVLAARQRATRGLPARRGRRPRRVVRLRDQVQRRRHGADRAGGDWRTTRRPRLRELAVTAFQLGGCAGLARCDFFVEPDGEILVNEINTMPGFTETSVYAKLWQASGLAYPDLCDRLLELAIERHTNARSHEF